MARLFYAVLAAYVGLCASIPLSAADAVIELHDPGLPSSVAEPPPIWRGVNPRMMALAPGAALLAADLDVDTTCSGNAQTCATNAVCGDTVLFTANTSYSPFVITGKDCTGNPIIFRTAGDANCAASGVRVNPATHTNMADVSTSSISSSVIDIRPGVEGIRLYCLELHNTHASTMSTTEYAVVTIGHDNVTGNPTTDAGLVPQDIELLGIYIHGTTNGNTKRAIAFNGDILFADSHCDEFHVTNDESNCVGGWNASTGTIRNNFLEAAGITILFGGSLSSIRSSAGQPHDILVEKNTIQKDPAWKPANLELAGTWQTKNLMELKNAVDVTVQHNIFQYSWNAPSEVGWCFLISNLSNTWGLAISGNTVANPTVLTLPSTYQDRISNGGTAYVFDHTVIPDGAYAFTYITSTTASIPYNNSGGSNSGTDGGVVTANDTWVTASRITVQNNIFRHCGNTAGTAGIDPYTGAGTQSADITFSNNLWYDIGGSEWCSSGCDALFQLSGVNNLTLNHLTIDGNGTRNLMFSGVTLTGFVAKNLLYDYKTYGFYDADSATHGTNALSNATTGGTLTFSVLANLPMGLTSANFPAMADLQFPTVTFSTLFRNTATGDYRLAAGSAYAGDGEGDTDPGVNMCNGSFPDPNGDGSQTFTDCAAQGVPVKLRIKGFRR